MSDFNGKPLVLQDKIERQFWGAVYAAEWNKGTTMYIKSRSYVADDAVVQMRIRQKLVVRYEGTTSRLCCAVCLAPLIASHDAQCPIGANSEEIKPHRADCAVFYGANCNCAELNARG